MITNFDVSNHFLKVSTNNVANDSKAQVKNDLVSLNLLIKFLNQSLIF